MTVRVEFEIYIVARNTMAKFLVILSLLNCIRNDLRRDVKAQCFLGEGRCVPSAHTKFIVCHLLLCMYSHDQPEFFNTALHNKNMSALEMYLCIASHTYTL